MKALGKILTVVGSFAAGLGLGYLLFSEKDDCCCGCCDDDYDDDLDDIFEDENDSEPIEIN